MKKKSSLFFKNIILIFFIFLMSYPTLANHWNAYRDEQLVAGYNQRLDEIDTNLLDDAMDAARQFNKKHTENYIEDVLDGHVEGYDKDSEYGRLLNIYGNGVIGYIEIPKINIKLTIYHGCGEETLSSGCGHIEGTSIPVGGTGTHAVLSAHRGLARAKLFTDLDKLENGDKFYIHVLDEILVYEVCDIQDMIEPDDLSGLQIEEGKDYVTLLTCTPYAVNTHRLLVKGIRVSNNDGEIEKMEAMIVPTGGMNIQEVISFVGVAFALVVLIIQNKKTR